MSIESILKELVDALIKSTAATEKLMALREDAIEHVRKAAETAPAVTKTRATAPKVEKTEARQITDSPEDRAPVKEPAKEKAAPVPSLEDLKNAMLSYMQEGVEDKEERMKRKAVVVKMLGKGKIYSDLPESERAAFIEELAKLKAAAEPAVKEEDDDELDIIGG